MKLQSYQITSTKDSSFYEFTSKGSKGDIEKGIQFLSIPVEKNESPVFNLALGDIDPETGELNDTTRSNNGDRNRIFATVGSAVLDFCKNHPNARIFAQGNTEAKQLIYRAEVAKNLEEVNKHFVVYGLIDHEWEVFKKNKKYKALLIEPA